MGLFMSLNLTGIESLTAEEILDEAFIADRRILKILNYLRWPETNGTPVRPVGCKRKKFNYKTMQVFAWSKLSDRQILALIFCARDEYPLPKVFKLVRIKHRNVKKWIDSINDEFCGEIIFPEPDERFLTRWTDRAVAVVVPPKVATKSEVAFFIMANRTATDRIFQERFWGYDLGKVRGIYNSLIGKKRGHLELVSQGIDPYEKHTVERERFESAQDKHFKPEIGIKDDENPENNKILSLDCNDLDHLVNELRAANRNWS